MFRKTFMYSLTMVAGLSSSAIVDAADIFAPSVFNWQFYLQHNQDLMAGGFLNEAGAKLHWQAFGVTEGRVATPGFSSLEYARLYNFYHNDPSGAITHWETFGYPSQNWIGHISGTDGEWSITNGSIRLSASRRTAGAIDSLIWNNKELINAYDHGREMQVAVATNECFNPTQAGSEADSYTSSSVIENITTSPGHMRVKNQPAYWVPPIHTNNPNDQCEGNTAYTSKVSDFHFITDMHLGVGSVNDALEFSTTVIVPAPLAYLAMEVPTAYLPNDMYSFYTTDISTGAFAVLPAQAHYEQGQPEIFATTDSNYAMGVVSTYTTATNATLSYGSFRLTTGDTHNVLNGSNKWNVVYRFNNGIAAGAYEFKTYVFVGNLNTVAANMHRFWIENISQQNVISN